MGKTIILTEKQFKRIVLKEYDRDEEPEYDIYSPDWDDAVIFFNLNTNKPDTEMTCSFDEGCTYLTCSVEVTDYESDGIYYDSDYPQSSPNYYNYYPCKAKINGIEEVFRVEDGDIVEDLNLEDYNNVLTPEQEKIIEDYALNNCFEEKSSYGY